MIKKVHETRCGNIMYLTNEFSPEKITLVFLPGLTADHRLFDKQIAAFENDYNVFVWDAPAHGESRPFSFDFTLMDKARWLEEILTKENVKRPIIVGQSMGGYVGQAYSLLFPNKLMGFVSIDSAPLGRSYMTGAEIWMLKNTQLMYRLYPWKALLKAGSEGVATTKYGIALMREMMETYSGNQNYYAKLSAHGFNMVANAIEENLSYALPKRSLLICGEKDKAGFTKRYNKAWHEKTGIPIRWIKNAGHNANTDAPEIINSLIKDFIERKRYVKEGAI